ncbi:MAG: fibronectin type III domain-containing protein [Ketobacter sp.]|nr:fibronectin type III domain-containing protein [Ketobacter sp.]
MKPRPIALFITILMFLLLPGPVQAVDFAWDVNTDNPVGYVLYFNEKGELDTPYNTAPIVHPSNTQSVIDDVLIPGVTYEFWVKAYNTRGESAKSNIVDFVIDPFAPPAENLPVILDFPTGPQTFKVM